MLLFILGTILLRGLSEAGTILGSVTFRLYTDIISFEEVGKGRYVCKLLQSLVTILVGALVHCLDEVVVDFSDAHFSL